MNKKRYWLLAIAVIWCLGGMTAQAQTAPPSVTMITKAVEVKYGDPYLIKSTLDPIVKANGTVITYDSRNKLLLLTGSPERIGEMESLIRRLDTAPPQVKNIQITIYLLTAGDSSSPATSMPPLLEPALKQLRSTFAYKSYELLDSIFIHNRTGERGSTSGHLSVRVTGPPDSKSGVPFTLTKDLSYSFVYGSSYLTQDDHGEVLHLNELDLILPAGRISTNLDIRSGQTVVVGKTNLEGGNSALIAVITAKIID